MSFIITMRSSLVLCVLLGVVLSVRGASVAPSVEAVSSPVTVTGLHNGTTDTMNTDPTTQYFTQPLTSVTCCATTPFQTTPTPTPTTTTTTTTPPTTTLTTTPTPPPTLTTPPPTTPPPTTLTTTPTTTLNPSTDTSQGHRMCPDGWEVFQGRCYYFVTEGMTWPQAQSNCALLESMLVSVHSIQEYGFLQKLTNSNGNQEAWLGGFYLQDQWLWIDGSWFYSNSMNNESLDTSNPCLMLNSYEAWSNSPCTASGYSSICVTNSDVPPVMLCPEGWTGFRGSCYFLNQESVTWAEADANCANLDASLVSVHSPEQYSFLYKQTTVYGFSPTWLGGIFFEGQWMWLDGSWFYQGFFTQVSDPYTYPCLATYSADGWTNYICQDVNLPFFCVKDAL